MTSIHTIENGIEGKMCIGFKSEKHWCPITEFTHNKNEKDGFTDRCKSCQYRYTITTSAKASKALTSKKYRQSEHGKLNIHKHRVRYKNIRDELKSNGCAICGYNKCIDALTFHHINPGDKKFNIEVRSIRFADDILVDEINKCIVLCENCHRELHYKERHPE